MGTSARTRTKPTAKKPAVSTKPSPPSVRAAEAAAAKQTSRTQGRRTFFARRPFGYHGQQFDREQVFELVGLANDEKLVRLGYCAALPAGASTFPCKHCGAAFLTIVGLNGHGDRQHVQKARPVMGARRPDETEVDFGAREAEFLASVQDAEIEHEQREESELDNAAPLHWDRTQAAMDERR
jgi:hypothetical protein